MEGIKPIETVYNGYKFRSRLEARWAVFFDEAKIRYEYEQEGFEDQTGERYLPDFYLPGDDIYVEVKPHREHAEEELTKAIRFMANAGKLLLVLREIPYDMECWTWWFPVFFEHPVSRLTEGVRITFGTEYDNNDKENGLYLIRNWAVGMSQRVFGVKTMFDPQNDTEIPQEEYPVRDICNTRYLKKCFMKARQARFEHGETPRQAQQGGL